MKSNQEILKMVKENIGELEVKIEALKEEMTNAIIQDKLEYISRISLELHLVSTELIKDIEHLEELEVILE